MKGKSFVSLLTGIAAGALLGVLVAPDKGTATRKKIREKLDDWEKAFADDLEEAEEQFSEEDAEEILDACAKREENLAEAGE